MAYYAVQHVTSVFDDTLTRITGAAFRHNIDQTDVDRYWYNTDRSISVYGYRNTEKGGCIYTIWSDDAIPGDETNLSERSFAFAGSHFQEPMLVDMVTGEVYAIPADHWQKEGGIDRFQGIPVYDAPILIAEKKLLKIQ